MHNWRLLLLAFLAALQPIASFTERSLVNGRQECSQHRSRRDTRLSIYGTFQNTKPAEERRLNYRDNLESRSYEALSGITTSERRVGSRDREVHSSPERISRLAQIQYRQISQTDRRDSLRGSDVNQRSREVSLERLPRNTRVILQNERHQPERESPSLFEGRKEERISQRSRFSVDARRDSRRNGDFVRGPRRITESRVESQRSRDEIARMEPARHREETRISMERARQMDREVSPRRDARLQQRERSMGRLTRNESQRRSSPISLRNYSRVSNMQESPRTSRVDFQRMFMEESRRGDSRNRFAVNRRDVHRDVRDSREKRNFARDENRVRTTRSLTRNLESRTAERSTEFLSKDFSQARSVKTKSSEVRHSRDTERRSNENIRSKDLEMRLTDAPTELRRLRVARARSLEMRSSDTNRRSNDKNNELRSTNLEMRSSEKFRSEIQEARSSETDGRTIERSSQVDRSKDLERRSSQKSSEIRRSRDYARFKSLETRSARTQQGVEERREYRQSLYREPLKQRETRQSYDREYRAQTPKERGLSMTSNEQESRKIDAFRSMHWTRLEFRGSERDKRTPARGERRTKSETRRAESKKNTNGESIRAQEMKRFNFRNTESSRRSTEQTTRLNVQARDIKKLALERDTVASRARVNVDSKRSRNAWTFVQDKPQVESKSFLMDWRYILYTVQGIYLASLLVKITGENGATEKKIRCHGLWTSAHKLLKLE